METFQSLLAKKLSNALKDAGLPEAHELTPATDPRFGDYQTNAALVLGKQRGENPRVVAEKIVSQLEVGDLCEPPVIAGAGFINFTLRPSAVAAKTVEVLRDERLGVHSQHRARRRTCTHRAVSRTRSDPRQSHWRLGHPVRNGDLWLEESAGSASSAARSAGGDCAPLQGDKRASDRGSASSRGLPPGVDKVAGWRQRKFRHLERMHGLLNAGFRARL
ncbi:MAG: hypothetical protein DMF00_07670 [Verrucomicrobia bacterium]|nr:MAG: hypothetical protein DMF00_07670 [Verrucomicrobiota bacterium]